MIFFKQCSTPSSKREVIIPSNLLYLKMHRVIGHWTKNSTLLHSSSFLPSVLKLKFV